jgi:sirohydrochlorin ferrochelatase
MNEPAQLTPVAVLLIAHGSRRPEANDDLVKLAELVRERGAHALVEVSYLELAKPAIPQGIARCVEQGAGRILMLPYFLSAGSHVVEDLERYRQEATQEHPQVTIELCPPLGLHPLMVDLVLTRLAEGSAANP